MNTLAQAAALLVYVLALWLGLYLLARDARKPPMALAGLGLLAYALALAADQLAQAAPTPGLAVPLARLHAWFVVLPALCWAGVMLHLLPPDMPGRAAGLRLWRLASLPLAGLLAGLALFGPAGGLAYAALAVTVAVLLAAALALALFGYRRGPAAHKRGLALLATLFFSLGSGLLLFPLTSLPHTLLVLAIGVDLDVLAIVIAAGDAFEEGESLLPDMARSFAGSALAVLLFGGLVAGAAALSGGLAFPLLALLLAVTAAAVATRTLGDALDALLDRLAFARWPRLRQARADLRAVASALPRAEAPEAAAPPMDDVELVRLTRRALSHLGDLPRLAASPLTQLSLITQRLAARGAPDNALERAAELRALLSESIERLRPRGGNGFGTSDEWRHYNALYYPYVAGLRPYSRRADHHTLDAAAAQVLAWFQSSVPERTLHNWQNAAARLIAEDLKSRSAQSQ